MDSVLKAFIIYIFLWAVFRLIGRRALGELTVFEFVLFLIIGGATQRALTGEDYSLINVGLIVATLALLDVAMSLLERRYRIFRKVARGVPMLVMADGQFMTERMRMARVTEEDIMEAARLHHGLESPQDVRFAVLEASGKISIVPRKPPPASPRRRVKSSPRRETDNP
jgi:uncharacterized membrane protein YcaP (DUF421 family)